MPTTRLDTDEAAGPFDIYETEHGPRHVGNPVRRLILAQMRGRELTVPRMIELTGLTKSTISTHLAILTKARLVAYREDPHDRRRKLYYCTSRHVGNSTRCADRVRLTVPDENAALADPGFLPRLLLRALVGEVRASGLDLGPLVHETGRRVGEMVGSQVEGDEPEAWAAQVCRFWKEAGLGEMYFEHDDGIRFVVTSCGLCCGDGDNDMGLCAITRGLLEAMASHAFRAAVQVRPVVADAASHQHGETPCGCSFAVRIGPEAHDGPEPPTPDLVSAAAAAARREGP